MKDGKWDWDYVPFSYTKPPFKQHMRLIEPALAFKQHIRLIEPALDFKQRIRLTEPARTALSSSLSF